MDLNDIMKHKLRLEYSNRDTIDYIPKYRKNIYLDKGESEVSCGVEMTIHREDKQTIKYLRSI